MREKVPFQDGFLSPQVIGITGIVVGWQIRVGCDKGVTNCDEL